MYCGSLFVLGYETRADTNSEAWKRVYFIFTFGSLCLPPPWVVNRGIVTRTGITVSFQREEDRPTIT